MPAVEARNLRKVYRTYRKENGIAGALKGLFHRRYDETARRRWSQLRGRAGRVRGISGPEWRGGKRPH